MPKIICKKYLAAMLAVSLICCNILYGCGKSNATSGNSIPDNNSTNAVHSNSPSNQITYRFEYEFLSPKVSWEELDLSKTVYKNQADFEQTVVNYIGQIETITGISDWYTIFGKDTSTITFKIIFRETVNGSYGAYTHYGTDGTSNETVTTIAVSYSLFESGQPWLSHELCHFMFDRAFSQSIEEGLCDYLKHKIEGFENSYPSDNINIYDALIRYGEKSIYSSADEATINEYETFKNETFALIGYDERDYPYGMSGKKAMYWYGYSEAFVTFLINKYGMPEFMNFYKNAKTTNDYRLLGNSDYKTLLDEWVEYYNSYTALLYNN